MNALEVKDLGKRFGTVHDKPDGGEIPDTLLYLAELKGKGGQAVTERASYSLDRVERPGTP